MSRTNQQSLSSQSKINVGYSQLHYQLTTGYVMPMFGLGTYLMNDGKTIMKVIDEALAIGYRLIDTAAAYGNEEDIGRALRTLLPKHNLTRQDIFITSKLRPTDFADALSSLQSSVNRLKCEYLDLYLIHWPGSSDYAPNNPINKKLREHVWINLIQGKKAGLVRSLGVSNFSIKHLVQLIQSFPNEKPTVNQIEWHPHWHQDAMQQFCRVHGILIQAYFSFGGTQNRYLFKDSRIVTLSERLGKSPAQVLLVWALQQNVAVIPKASTRIHLQTNINLNFSIPEEYLIFLNHLDQIRYGGDPNTVE